MKHWSKTLLSRFARSGATSSQEFTADSGATADSSVSVDGSVVTTPVSPLSSLIASFNAAMDPSANIASFLQYIWNVNTAIGYGLDVWGTIVGVSRIIPGSPPITLLDTDFRTLILVKAAANIGNVTIQTLNRLLSQIFASYGLVYVQDNLNMTLTYVFGFLPTTAQQAIVENSGVLPRPAGVDVSYTWPSVQGPLFGFDSDNTYVSGFDTGSWATS